MIRLGYDGAVNSALSRVTSINDGNTALALYGYTGTSRRVSTTLDGVAVQSFGSAGSYSGLDQFGRVIDLKYAWLGNFQTIQEYQYGYDEAGNRTYARVTQAEVGGVAHENDRSYLYTYDALSRLIDAQLGRLNAGNTSIDLDPNVALTRQLAWTLDNLGNWTGDLSGPGLLRDDYLNGVSPAVRTQDVSHAVDHANQLAAVTVAENGGDPATQRIVHDAAGNLVWDGRLFYQYDGFNRLVQVNEASQLDPNFYPFINGKLYYYPDDPPPVGPTLATFIYDGLGRLIQTRRFDQQGHTQVEEYYYDGVRRILEIEITDPNTAGAETAYREYVYGPGYVDEVVCQIAGSAGVPPATYYYLQDGNYNVTAVIGPPDPNATTGPGVSPAVLWQYTYEPYGQLVFAECGTGVSPVVLPVNRIGHQGLFFERFCVDPNDSVTAPVLLPDDPATGRRVVGLYNNRNRWYSPELGRFVQKDMNETAMPIITALAMNGKALTAAISAFNAQDHCGNGMNVYQFVESNPVDQTDPTGLFTYLEIMCVDAIHWQMADYTVQEGTSLLGIIAGLSDIFSQRNVELDEFTQTANDGDIDAAIAAQDLAFTLRASLFAGGIFAAGLQMSLASGGRTREAESFEAWLNKGEKNTFVYVGRRGGKTVYVGISGNIEQRQWQHNFMKRGFKIEPIMQEPLTRNQALAIEQLIKQRNPHFENIRNPISKLRRYFNEAVQWAEGFTARQKIPTLYW